ncbi:hypothetical protein OG618_37085 (plasmid) [Kitasatospora sp. NBC_01246]|uniref:hypothetical protein n=1 Tax=Kitasatospora sp. NBC_01246 TaxID=2903570 RepID=UPI002E2FE2EE|nr:hypothetical protein [Kitasatospora sp. NBC_01246]
MKEQEQVNAPSVRDLTDAYQVLLGKPDLTRENARKYGAVVHEVEQAVREGVLPSRGPLTAEALDAFLAAAEDGLYRSAASGSGQTAQATNRGRVGCLNALSALAERPLNLAHRTPAPGLKPGITTRQAGVLRRYINTHNALEGLDRDHRRILLAIGLVLDTRARSGELAAMLTSDLAVEPRPRRRPPHVMTVPLRLNPQRRPDPARILTEPIELHPSTRASLERWLPIRELLVGELRTWHRQHPDQDVDPHHDALFVSLQPNHTGGQPSVEGGTPLRPAGMPLQAQGLRRALDRAAERLNAERRYRGQPLPTMEQLRRIVEA